MASGQYRKQDIALIFGLQGGGSLSGESGALIKQQLDAIVTSLNSSSEVNRRKIALNLNISQTKANFKDALKNNIIPALSNQKQFNISISLDKIDASKAIQNVKEELKNVLNSLSIQNGVKIDDIVKAVNGANGNGSSLRALTAEEQTKLEVLSTLQKSIASTYRSSIKSADETTIESVTKYRAVINDLDNAMRSYAENIRNLTPQQQQDEYDLLVMESYELQRNLEIEKQGLSVEKQVTLEQEKQNKLLTEESNIILTSNEAAKKYGKSIKSAYDSLIAKSRGDADISAITSIMTGSAENAEWFRINAQIQEGAVLEESRRAQFVATGEIIKQQIEQQAELMKVQQSTTSGQSKQTKEFNASAEAAKAVGQSVETLYKSMLKGSTTTAEIGKVVAILKANKDWFDEYYKIQSGEVNYSHNDYYAFEKKGVALKEHLDTLQLQTEEQKKQIKLYDASGNAAKTIGQSVMSMYNSMISGVSTPEELQKILDIATQYSAWFTTEANLKKGNITLTEDEKKKHAELGIIIKGLLSDIRDESAELEKQNRIMKERERLELAGRIKTYMDSNPLIQNAREYSILQSFYSELTSGKEINEEHDKNIASAFGSIQSSMRAAKLEGNKLSATFKDIFKQVTGFYSVATVVRRVYSEMKKMASAVKEIDTAMTELRKVTDETEVTYDKFLVNAAKRAKELGATVADTTNATADFARLGYDIEGAEALADTAIVYKNVGDGIESIDEASSSIISTLQAFGIEAQNAMSIVDRFNEVGNNFAISSQGVGEALIRSASALSAAGNDIDESIAMIAATNEVVQAPDKVGNALKTVSMYLRSSAVELEEAGESTDGMAESVSKLREKILALTKNKVDIQIDESTYKSPYKIIEELSEVWDKLSDIDRAGILELIGGRDLPWRTVMCA